MTWERALALSLLLLAALILAGGYDGAPAFLRLAGTAAADECIPTPVGCVYPPCDISC